MAYIGLSDLLNNMAVLCGVCPVIPDVNKPLRPVGLIQLDLVA